METTTTPQTSLRKGHYGWTATTYYPLAGDRVLKVHTMKFNSGVATNCQAVERKIDGMFISEKFTMYQDFNQNLMKHSDIKRVTEKSISEAHAKALQNIEPMLTQVKEFYNI